MRVSGWSSDVCSADLRVLRRDDTLVDLPLLPAPAAPPPGALRHPRPARRAPRPLWLGRPLRRPRGLMAAPTGAELDAFRLSVRDRSEEHTSEVQSLMRLSYAAFGLTKKNKYKYSH